jgi:peptidoglycan/LPS O-acetylase OafA/YrhL
VDVFFVISGYLISRLLYWEWMASGRIDLLAFYARRIRRILPAMAVVVLITVGASMFLLPSIGEQRNVAQSASASLLFAANFYFQNVTGGYFDSGSDRLPLLHLWSLAVEEQFYFVWPLGLILLLRFWPKHRLRAITVLAVVSLLMAEWLIFSNPNAAFYQMAGRFWELAVGGLIAMRPPDQLPDGRAHAFAGLVLVLIALFIPTAHFPGVGSLPAVIGAAFLLHAVHGSNQLGKAGALLTARPMVFIGLISYSLYLWHWPLLAFERATRVAVSPASARTAVVVSAVLLAWLSYRYV